MYFLLPVALLQAASSVPREHSVVVIDWLTQTLSAHMSHSGQLLTEIWMEPVKVKYRVWWFLPPSPQATDASSTQQVLCPPPVLFSTGGHGPQSVPCCLYSQRESWFSNWSALGM